jgi:hypothetical protein
MSLYSDSTVQPRRQSAQYYNYPPRRIADLSSRPRVELYEKDQSISRRYVDSDRDQQLVRVVRGRPSHARDSSSDDDYERRPRRKSVVIRPRSTSRVRIQEPVLVRAVSLSDDEPRRRRKQGGDDTRIRATSRPGKKNEYAFVRTPSKGRKKSDARKTVVTDLELKNDRRHKEFQSRRNDLENTEALVLVRARSRERERLEDDSSDEYIYDGRRRLSHYDGHTTRKRGSIDGGRKVIVAARNDRDRDDRRRSIQDPKLYTYGTGLIVAGDADDLRSDRRGSARRRVSLSPDRETIDSSVLGGSVRRADSVTSGGQNSRRSRAYQEKITEPERQVDPLTGSAYLTDNDRRARDREREAIEREKRAIDREKAVLDREKLLVDREKRLPAPIAPDDLRRSAGDYLKQGNTYLKDGQKYYKTGQGLVGGMKNLLK